MNRFTDFLKYFYQKSQRLKLPFLVYPKGHGRKFSVSPAKMREFNNVRFHGPKRLACYNPFVNLYFNSRGQAVVCCRNQDTVLGTYPESNIKDIWFGTIADKLREHLLNNDFSMGCSYCQHQFETSRFYGLPSMHADYYASTKVKYPKIIELELSNTCNLQCVMCSGIVSSTIRKHREKLPPLENHYDEKFVEQLREFLPHAKEIKFYGGEPFLIDTYYQIWDELLKIKSKSKLHVVTNGTILNDKVRNYLGNLKFTITVSFDAMNKELFESIRVGANFENVKSHIEEYNVLLGGKGLSLSLTPMKTNCREVPIVIDYCNTLNATINLSFVENPSEMALWTMCSQDLKELELYYKSFNFKPYKGVNAEYNIKAYYQFVNQIATYQQANQKIEDEFFQKLKTEDEARKIVKLILSQAIKENIIFESDRTEIVNVINKIGSKLSNSQQHVYFGNLAALLENRGLELVNDLMTDGLDTNKLNDSLQRMSKMPDIYKHTYL
ncbi:MAG: twitch domain-containing radical SAM protein [Bacteroidales bacterium]|nr:twitch domain-containing radical SAM protein [Bacteroidales bacterium]MDD4217322.1 twitch domain-containing radical SAM protein [Bacteroidales bacterium]MDY0140986.1 twitch domain-containing radical SAM protein [Bacteroidales bacterium]